MMNISKSGFTIVELLIVVIVIAILAAVAVGAYNGIMERAKNQRIVSAVDEYIKALKLYHTDTGAWPYETYFKNQTGSSGPSGVVLCFTNTPDYNNLKQKHPQYVDGVWTTLYECQHDGQSQSVQSSLRPYMSTFPTMASNELAIVRTLTSKTKPNVYVWAGLQYNYSRNTYDTNQRRYRPGFNLTYKLFGDNPNSCVSISGIEFTGSVSNTNSYGSPNIVTVHCRSKNIFPD